MLPNKACTRRVGFCGIFRLFPGFEFFPALTVCPRSAHTRVTQQSTMSAGTGRPTLRPHAGNASRWP